MGSCQKDRRKEMEKDTSWKVFFARNDRYADIINGLGCGGSRIVRAEDLQEADSGSGKRSRDVLRKVALGMNFVLIGIESQDKVDYGMPFRNMVYDVGTYEKQMEAVRREVRKHPQDILPGEYLYGFKKDSRLHPVVTFVLYSGEKPWDGAESLHEILDFTDVPESLRSMVADYKINVIDIRRFEHSEIFQTDVKQVFDFLRLSGDKEALLKLVEEEAYKCVEEDAFEVMAAYSNFTELFNKAGKEEQDVAGKGERKDMSNALRELMEDSREEGKAEGKAEVIRRFLLNGGSEEEAERMLGVTKEEIAFARERV